jgi:hypothetical protein
MKLSLEQFPQADQVPGMLLRTIKASDMDDFSFCHGNDQDNLNPNTRRLLSFLKHLVSR